MKLNIFKILASMCLLASVALFIFCHPMIIQKLFEIISIRIMESDLSNHPEAASHLLKVSNILPIILKTYGTFFLLVAILSYIISLQDTPFSVAVYNRTKHDIGRFRHGFHLFIKDFFVSRLDLYFILTIFAVGLCLRAYFLGQPMRYDESANFLNNINRSLPFLFLYNAPNNHVLHTLLVKLSTLFMGSSPASIRFPAFLSGLASIPLIFVLCRAVIHRKSGILATIGMSIAPFMVLHSTMARGYSLLLLLTLFLALVGIIYINRPSFTGCFVISLITALGMFTIPTMLFPCTAIYFWLVCLLFIKKIPVKVIFYKFITPVGIMTFFLTLIFYTPTITASGGVDSILRNHWVQPLQWKAFFHQISPHFWFVFTRFTRDIPHSILLLTGVLMITGILVAFKRHNWELLLILPTMLLGSGLVFFLKQSIPYPRIWIYLIPFILIIADSGLTYFIEKFSNRFQSILTTLIILYGAFFAFSLMSRETIAKYPDTGSFPEAQYIARYMKPRINKDDTVHTLIPADYPLRYYFMHYGIDEQIWEPKSKSRKDFYVVRKSGNSIIDDKIKESLVKLIEIDDACLYMNVDD